MKAVRLGYTAQRGFTVIELIIVVAIIALLSIPLATQYRKWQDANTVKEWTEMTRDLVIAVQSKYSTQPFSTRYAGLTTAKIENELPSGMALTSGSILLPWGGNITVSPSGITGGTGNIAARFALTDLPQSVCKSLIRNLEGLAPVVLNAGGSVIKNTNSNDLLTADEIDATCTTNVGSNDFSLVVQ